MFVLFFVICLKAGPDIMGVTLHLPCFEFFHYCSTSLASVCRPHKLSAWWLYCAGNVGWEYYWGCYFCRQTHGSQNVLAQYWLNLFRFAHWFISKAIFMTDYCEKSVQKLVKSLILRYSIEWIYFGFLTDLLVASYLWPIIMKNRCKSQWNV